MKNYICFKKHNTKMSCCLPALPRITRFPSKVLYYVMKDNAHYTGPFSLGVLSGSELSSLICSELDILIPFLLSLEKNTFYSVSNVQEKAIPGSSLAITHCISLFHPLEPSPLQINKDDFRISIRIPKIPYAK